MTVIERLTVHKSKVQSPESKVEDVLDAVSTTSR
jgi:hypothetical protein